MVKGITTDQEAWARYLSARLEGPAQLWLLGQGADWEAWGYSDLKRELTRHFRGEQSVYRRKLLSLRCNTGLPKFHLEFTAAAAAAMPVMGEEWVKEQYLDQVQPRELAPFLRARSSEPLQILMAAALDLEADLKSCRAPSRPTFTTTFTTTPSGGRAPQGGMV